MNYTKEFIELAKNKRVQELRPEPNLIQGDWVFNNFRKDISFINYICLVGSTTLNYGLYSKNYAGIGTTDPISQTREDLIWLPTGDQLDEEIIKRLNEHEFYEVYFEPNICIVSYDSEDLDFKKITFSNPNSLIAKIKLLIALLEEK